MKAAAIRVEPAGWLRPSSAETATDGASANDFSSPEVIFRDIVRGLYNGAYVPGQRLVEADLTQKWGVSRGTVREALNRLSAEGIVVLSRHRGASIRVLTREEMQDLLEILETLIGMAARLAAKWIDEEDNRALFRDAFETLMGFRAHPDSFDLLRARNRFYRALTTVGGNRELHSMLGRMQVHLLRVQLRALHAGLVTERFEDYEHVGTAVLTGDLRRAELAARKHVRAMATALEQVPA